MTTESTNDTGSVYGMHTGQWRLTTAPLADPGWFKVEYKSRSRAPFQTYGLWRETGDTDVHVFRDPDGEETSFPDFLAFRRHLEGVAGIESVSLLVPRVRGLSLAGDDAATRKIFTDRRIARYNSRHRRPWDRKRADPEYSDE